MLGYPAAYLLNPAVDLVTIAVVGAGVYFARRQELSRYHDAKVLLVLAWSLLLGVVIIQTMGDIYPSIVLERAYTLASVALVLSDVAILSSLSYVIYVRPSEPTFRARFRAVFGPHFWPSGLALFLFVAYLACMIAYLFIYQPFIVTRLDDLAGFRVASTIFDQRFLELLFLVMVGYLVYPCGQLFLAARKLPDPDSARSLTIFTVGWIVMGLAIFVFDGFFTVFGYDASSFGYSITAIAFASSVNAFRRASLLQEFFQPLRAAVLARHPFTSRLGRRSAHQEGEEEGMMLLQVDPSSPYEDVIRDFAVEQISNGRSFFAFTARGRPVYAALSEVPEVRLFVMTREASYPKPGSKPFEILVPQNDSAVLLDVLDRTLASNPESGIALVFDSVSDLLLTSGLEKSHKFIKEVLEITASPRVTGIFIMIAGAHEDKTENTIMSLFGSHLTVDPAGLRVTR